MHAQKWHQSKVEQNHLDHRLLLLLLLGILVTEYYEASKPCQRKIKAR